LMLVYFRSLRATSDIPLGYDAARRCTRTMKIFAE
jgi:hypothetical protein